MYMGDSTSYRIEWFFRADERADGKNNQTSNRRKNYNFIE